MKQDLLYRAHPVPPALAGSVQGIWSLRGQCQGAAPHVVLPDGCISLVLNFGAPMASAMPGATSAPARRHGLLGEVRRPLRLVAEGEVDLVGVRLYPGASLPLSRVPLPELVDQVTDEAALTSRVAGLVKTLESAAPEERVALLATGLQAVTREDQAPHAALHAAVRRIFQLQGNVRIEALAAAVGLSRRTLERLFSLQLGFSPKSLCDVLRFQSAVRLSQEGSARNWADIAALAGYFDQSHLIRDFRRFAGETPTGLASEAAS